MMLKQLINLQTLVTTAFQWMLLMTFNAYIVHVIRVNTLDRKQE